MARKTLKDLSDSDLNGKRLLIRADFNIPLDGETITDDARIQKTLPTLQYALTKGARLILMAHLGRPKGKPNPEFSLKPVAKRLSELLGQSVELAPDCIGEVVAKKVSELKPGQVLLLENVRFHAEEEKNDPAFAKQLAALGDLFVNDAFGACHRAHASTAGIADFLPAVSGLLMAKEIEFFDRILENPESPFVAIMGGAKVHDKIKVIQSLLQKVDTLLIGGGMAYTFVKASGKDIGTSKLDEEGLKLVPEILSEAKKRNVKIVVSFDWVTADDFKADAKTGYAKDSIPDGWMGLDVGPETRKSFQEILSEAKLVLWNGPLGVFEWTAFEEGTKSIAHYLANSKATVVVGGGDSAAAVKKYKLEEKMDHVSTGGGASLEYLEGRVLPGIVCLEEVAV